MEEWIFITGYVCFYGCFKEIRPAAHFLTQYLEGPWINLTHSQVTNEVYPTWTYSYLFFLPVIFFFTVFVRYKPFIVLESVALVLTWVLLTWGKGLLIMQLMQVSFGLATAADVSYYTYIYTKVPKSKYRKITSFTRAAVWVGRLLSAISAQALVSTHAMDYFTLNYLSLACVLFALVLALFLPRTHKTPPLDPAADPEVQERLSAPPDEQNKGTKLEEITKVKLKSDEKLETESENTSFCSNYRKTLLEMGKELKRSYRKKLLLQWSIWWALATCGNYQVSNYVQPLWEEIYPAEFHENLYHGAIDAVKMLLGIIVTLAMGFIKTDWNKYGEFTLGIVSVVEAAMLFIMAKTSDIWIAYFTICIFKVLHQMLITIASFQIAKDLSQNSRPVVYGCNTFAALILHTILTLIVVDKRGLCMNPRSQFVIYSSYFFIMGVFFAMMLVIRTWRRCRTQPVNSELKENKTFQAQQTVAHEVVSKRTIEC